MGRPRRWSWSDAYAWLGRAGARMSHERSWSTRAGRGRRGREAQRVFQDYLQELFQREPLTATRLGDHAFDDQLDDLSAEARKATLDSSGRPWRDLPPKRSTSTGSRATARSITRSSAATSSARSGWRENFRPFEDDPRIYGDYISESVYLLLTQSSLPEGRQPQERPGPDGEDPGRRRRRPGETIKKPPGSRSRRRSGRPRGPSRSTRRRSFTLAGQPPGKGSSAARPARSSTALKDYLAFLKNEVLPRSDRRLADRPRAVRQEARPGARRGHLGRRGARRGRARGGPGRARDGA